MLHNLFDITTNVANFEIAFAICIIDTEDGSVKALLQILYGQYLILGAFGSYKF